MPGKRPLVDNFMADLKMLAGRRKRGEINEETFRKLIESLLDRNKVPAKDLKASLERGKCSVPNFVKKQKLRKIGTILQREVEELQDSFVLGRELGRGQYGITHECTHLVTKDVFACKSISKLRKILTKRDAEVVRREIAIMYHLQGVPNVVELKTAYEDKQDVHMVMDICRGGELFDRIIKLERYTEKQAAQAFRTIIKVVAQCHALGVMHRDLKPENFLLADETEDAALMVTDFGLACFFQPGQIFQDVIGTPYYVAPEVLKKSYGPECDVWSSGVILYILLCGVPPFWAETDSHIYSAVKEGTFDLSKAPWDQISDGAKDCVRRLLVVDPAKRMTTEEALAHPWVQEDGSAPDTPLDETVLARLKRFSGMCYLKKIALNVIAKTMSEPEIEGLKELFKSFDIDNSGSITIDELHLGIRKMGNTVTELEVEELMSSTDVDKDGRISYEEFIAATLHLNRVNSEEKLWKAFISFDTDGSGYISRDELKTALENYNVDMSRIDVDLIVAEVDTDMDGKIDYEEFANMMRSNVSNNLIGGFLGDPNR